jgi:hypothetical protein
MELIVVNCELVLTSYSLLIFYQTGSVFLFFLYLALHICFSYFVVFILSFLFCFWFIPFFISFVVSCLLQRFHFFESTNQEVSRIFIRTDAGLHIVTYCPTNNELKRDSVFAGEE